MNGASLRGASVPLSHFFDHELVDEAEEGISSALGRRLVHERKVMSEGTFALAMELHGLRRIRFRGRRKVQVQLWLIAAAMNIKRAAKSLSPLPSAAAAAGTAVLESLFSDPCHLLIFIRSTSPSANRI